MNNDRAGQCTSAREQRCPVPWPASLPTYPLPRGECTPERRGLWSKGTNWVPCTLVDRWSGDPAETASSVGSGLCERRREHRGQAGGSKSLWAFLKQAPRPPSRYFWKKSELTFLEVGIFRYRWKHTLKSCGTIWKKDHEGGEIGSLLGREAGGQSRENGRVTTNGEWMPSAASETGCKLSRMYKECGSEPGILPHEGWMVALSRVDGAVILVQSVAPPRVSVDQLFTGCPLRALCPYFWDLDLA